MTALCVLTEDSVSGYAYPELWCSGNQKFLSFGVEAEDDVLPLQKQNDEPHNNIQSSL